MEYYTAIGIKRKDAYGRFCVEAGGESYVLGEIESYIWSAAACTFQQRKGIYDSVKYLLDIVFRGKRKITEEEFTVFFQRLCVRGLLAASCGENKQDILWDFFHRAEVHITRFSVRERISIFLYGIECGMGMRKAARAFYGNRLNRKEKQVINKLARSGDICHWLEEERKSGNDHAADLLTTLLALYERRQVAIANVREE